MLWSEVLEHTVLKDDPMYHAIYDVLERIYIEHDTITKGEIYDVMNKIYIEVHSRFGIMKEENEMLGNTIKKLKKENAELKAKLSIKDYQLKQCSYIACEYEKRFQAHMGVDEFYEYMRDMMHNLLIKDADFLDPEFLDEDEDLDEIVEDIKNVSSDNGSNANNK